MYAAIYMADLTLRTAYTNFQQTATYAVFIAVLALVVMAVWKKSMWQLVGVIAMGGLGELLINDTALLQQVGDALKAFFG